jgi:hypothetical protein
LHWSLTRFSPTGAPQAATQLVEPPKESVRDFKTLEIRDFHSNLQDEDSLHLAAQFADRLHKAVMKDRQQHPSESVFDQVVRGDTATGDVLVLDGTIISFEKGSRAKRYLIGFGAGKAFCTIQSRSPTRPVVMSS